MINKKGVQKACSLMDRALVLLTRGCESETFAEISPCLHFSQKNNIINNKIKKENPSLSQMDRALLTIDKFSKDNNYLKLSGVLKKW